MPLSSNVPAASDAMAASEARRVASSRNTVPGRAAPWMRAAVLTMSPATMPWPTAPIVTAVSPVAIPALAASSSPASPPRSRTAATSSRAARTERSASSSCAAGEPQTATTASPMNFSMVPPWRSTIARAVSKYRDSSSRTSSGSRPSAWVVKPTRSVNSTDTIRRSAAGSSCGAGASIGEPQAPQNRSSGSFAVPHAGHRASSGVPQLPQNRRPARFSAPQELHTMRRSVLHP